MSGGYVEVTKSWDKLVFFNFLIVMINFRVQKDKHRLRSLIFQNSRSSIDYQTGEQFARMFSSLQKMDLKKCSLSDETVKHFIKMLNEKDNSVEKLHNEKDYCIEKLDLTGCSFSKTSLEELEDLNRRRGNIVLFGAFDDATHDSRSCMSFRICCKN